MAIVAGRRAAPPAATVSTGPQPGSTFDQVSRTRRRRFRLTEASVAFILALATYLTAAALLVFHYRSIFPDAMSRLANGYFVLFSRDPHLAAMGFVWNPLPSVSVMPLLPLKAVWPALVERAFAANIMSSVFMAGSVAVVVALLRDLGVRRTPRIILTVLFALNPMILYYGANGMSEALFLLLLLVTTRSLTLWLGSGRLNHLVWTGVGLGLAYLTRYEAAAAALAVTVLVSVVTFARTDGDRARRRTTAVSDAAIVALPFVACFVGWAAVSWVIVGHPFDQFSSVYGNTAQLRLAGDTAPAVQGTPPSVLRKLLSIEPFLPVAGALVAVVAIRRRDPRALAAAAVVGGVLAFALAAAVTGATMPHVRYLVTAIPLVTLLAGSYAAIPTGRFRGRWGAAALTLAATAIAGSSIPVVAQTLMDPKLAPVEWEQLQVLSSERMGTGPSDVRYPYVVAREVARYLDALNLPEGSVLVDLGYSGGAFGPAVVLASRHPRQFVIPPDRDFDAAVGEPVLFRVRYLLAQAPAGLGELDALNRAYPQLYESGADGVATLERGFGPADAPTWRLYRVN